MELVEFLRARISEDEAKVSDPPEYDDQPNDMRIGWAEVGAISEVLLIGEARLRAECEAKRRVVAACEDVIRHDTEGDLSSFATEICERLATAYADHPDYREEWRP